MAKMADMFRGGLIKKKGESRSPQMEDAIRFGEAEAVRRGVMDKPNRDKRLLKRGTSNTTLGQASTLGD